MSPSRSAGAILLGLLAANVLGQTAPPQRWGHSAHGAAFDEGPRQKPWRFDNIGRIHFPITTRVPEAQEWFDQGMTLMHSFWFHEAERSFRWCLKLDPDCAMAYWGLSQVGLNWLGNGLPDAANARYVSFLREAIARKDALSPRERMYIDAWAAAFDPSGPVGQGSDWALKFKTVAAGLERIVLAHPEDVEAKALFALYSIPVSKQFPANRVGNELILQQVLAAKPDHPGAHHYRIHTWDGPDAFRALDSCARYGQVAPGSGHAVHMPGHAYSAAGMWHEAALSMDAATRTEKRHMQERLALPHDDFNYAHNRNYLAYIQEQLGRPSLALAGARDLLAAPLDPKYNDPASFYSVYNEGMTALIRGLVKYERWDDILTKDLIPWRDTLWDRLWRPYAEALAHTAKGDLRAAQQSLDALRALGAEAAKPENAWTARFYQVQTREVEGLLSVARGELMAGLNLLHEAARVQIKLEEDDIFYNDPPAYPRGIYNVIGELYLTTGSPRLAAAAFEAALKDVANDGFAFSGLTRAHAALGESAKATPYFARLLHVWSGAEPGLRWLEDCRRLGLSAAPHDDSPGTQRLYQSVDLSALGPANWQPYAAPPLEALDSQEQRVTLEDYRGKNVILVFYLGEECAHCLEQLQTLHQRGNELALRNTQVLAISSSPPEKNAASSKLGQFNFRLLSDADHANARRFKAFDDFEEIELHATILIDRQGRVHWGRFGGDPFMDVDFLLRELDRMNAAASGALVAR